jgi:hypothetical protein
VIAIAARQIGKRHKPDWRREFGSQRREHFHRPLQIRLRQLCGAAL